MRSKLALLVSRILGGPSAASAPAELVIVPEKLVACGGASSRRASSVNTATARARRRARTASASGRAAAQATLHAAVCHSDVGAADESAMDSSSPSEDASTSGLQSRFLGAASGAPLAR